MAQARNVLSLNFYVSAQIFNECPFITGKDFQEFNDGVKIELIKDSDIDGVKRDLVQKGVKLFAQDNDLSLVALAKQLRSKDNEVVIVSDDFKLAQNVESLQYRIRFQSLPTFLQFLTKHLSGQSHQYWKQLQKRVLRLNLDYMMSRKEQYAPQAKIAWLIENACEMVDEGVRLKVNVDSQESAKEEDLEDKELLKMCEDYIQNKLISKENLELIQPYVEGLEEVKKSRELLRKARDSLVLKDSKETLSILRKADAFLIRLTQKMGTQLSEKYFMFLEKFWPVRFPRLIFYDPLF